jgi:UDP-glucose 4-epimerase
VFEQYSIDAVIHTAGFKSIEESNLKPLEYYKSLTNGTYIPEINSSRSKVCKVELAKLSTITTSCPAVIHTAGFKSIEESNLKPLEYYNDNVSCIMSLLRAMQRTGVRHFIHLSIIKFFCFAQLQTRFPISCKARQMNEVTNTRTLHSTCN